MDLSLAPDAFDHQQLLTILARADASRLKAFGQDLIEDLGQIEVLKSQTGLVMLPMRDTAQGTAFHLGEVLVSEAHIKSGDVVGYGMRRGRDLEAAMAMALIDLSLASNLHADACMNFLHREFENQQQEDETTLRKIEATRVDMETF